MAKKKKVDEQKKNQKKPKKLSPREIRQAVEKIRRGYDDYMVRHVRSRRARDAFELRYLEALRARVALDRFVAEELRWLRRLEAEAAAEERAAQQVAEKQGGKNGGAKRSFADRIMDEMKSRVEKYPVVGLEADEVLEVDKLYGALAQFERKHWPAIDRIYRKVYPSRYSGPRIVLENRIFELAEPTSGLYPQRLQTLINLLGRFPRNYREIEWEVKQCILSASFFLHMAEEEFTALAEEESLSDAERQAVDKGRDFVHTVIEDFRLTDLKETNGRR